MCPCRTSQIPDILPKRKHFNGYMWCFISTVIYYTNTYGKFSVSDRTSLFLLTWRMGLSSPELIPTKAKRWLFGWVHHLLPIPTLSIPKPSSAKPWLYLSCHWTGPPVTIRESSFSESLSWTGAVALVPTSKIKLKCLPWKKFGTHGMNPTSLEQMSWLFQHCWAQLTLSSVVNNCLSIKQGLEMDRC